MLRTIGVSSVEELFRDIPAGVRLDRELQLERPLPEAVDAASRAGAAAPASAPEDEGATE